ncbi:MAG: tetratricopeptide repeat protein [Nannocystaceae bacterium]|nr:hypothetical protein [bacterium]
MSGAPKIAAVLVAGWLAQALASTDADVDAGVVAYEASDYETALARFDAAKDRLGERPEIALDRGLALLRLDKLDEARAAFERATEAEDGSLRASAFYELGNLDFDAESYEPAIARYIEALQANPLHANAKWNLELALQKKKEQEEEEEENEEEQDEEEQDEEENEDEQDEGEENEDEQDEGEENEDEQDEGEEDEDEQDEGENEGENEDQQSEDEQEPSDQEEEQPSEGENEDEPPQDEPPRGDAQDEPQQQPPAEPKPVDRMDMQRALEQLDEQDPFTLDKPQGGYVQPEKDW